MKIYNNYQGIDVKLLKESFPYAMIINSPEMVEFDDDPTADNIEAWVTDTSGRTSLQCSTIGCTKSTMHWPGTFGFCNADDACPNVCHFVERDYSIKCTHCKFINK